MDGGTKLKCGAAVRPFPSQLKDAGGTLNAPNAETTTKLTGSQILDKFLDGLLELLSLFLGKALQVLAESV